MILESSQSSDICREGRREPPNTSLDSIQRLRMRVRSACAEITVHIDNRSVCPEATKRNKADQNHRTKNCALEPLLHGPFGVTSEVTITRYVQSRPVVFLTTCWQRHRLFIILLARRGTHTHTHTARSGGPLIMSRGSQCAQTVESAPARRDLISVFPTFSLCFEK
jgi:hypothetical protein